MAQTTLSRQLAAAKNHLRRKMEGQDMAKKPKARCIRAHFDYNDGSFRDPNEDYPANATIVMDGATVPLPAIVRRVMRHLPVIKDALRCVPSHYFSDCRDAFDPRCPTCLALEAVKSHERATKAKGRKS